MAQRVSVEYQGVAYRIRPKLSVCIVDAVDVVVSGSWWELMIVFGLRHIVMAPRAVA